MHELKLNPACQNKLFDPTFQEAWIPYDNLMVINITPVDSMSIVPVIMNVYPRMNQA